MEIVFKDISVKKIAFLLVDLVSRGSGVVSYGITFDCSEIKWNVIDLNKIFLNSNDFGLFFNLIELKAGVVDLVNCGVAVYRYKDAINLEINFQLSDLKNISLQSLAKNLMILAKDIADKYQIEEYLCGIEPAYDLQTRLFTNEKLGPFFF